MLHSTRRKLLNALERFFGTDISYLVRESFWLTTASSVGMITGFLLSLAYANYLSKEVYGNYRYIIATISIFSILSLPGLGTSLIRSTARGFPGTYKHIAPLIFLSSLSIGILSLGLALWNFKNGSSTLAWGFFIGALLVPFAEGLGSWRTFFDGNRLFREKAYRIIIEHVVFVAGMLVALYAITADLIIEFWEIPLLIGVYMVMHALPNGIFFLQTMRRIPLNAPTEKGVLRHGIHLTIAGAPTTIASYIDSILLYAYLGPVAVSIYSFAIIVPEQIKKLINNSIMAALPKLASKTDNTRIIPLSVRATLTKKIIKASLITTLMIGAYIILAPFIYQVFFPKYIEAVTLSQVFALSLTLMPFSLFSSVISIEKNMRNLYLQRTIVPIIQIILLLILVPLYGLWGAISGRVLGRFANYMMAFLFFKINK